MHGSAVVGGRILADLYAFKNATSYCKIAGMASGHYRQALQRLCGPLQLHASQCCRRRLVHTRGGAGDFVRAAHLSARLSARNAAQSAHRLWALRSLWSPMRGLLSSI